mgnify:CR=1 FL=1
MQCAMIPCCTGSRDALKPYPTNGQDEATAQCVAESVVGSAGAETMLGWFSEASTSGDSSELEVALSRGFLDCGVDTGDGSAPVESIPSIGGGLSGN